MERNAFESLFDAIDAIEEHGREQDLVLLPPPNDPYASDEEIGDDDIGFVDNIGLPNDVAGTLEVHDRGEESSEDDEGPEQSDIRYFLITYLTKDTSDFLLQQMDIL